MASNHLDLQNSHCNANMLNAVQTGELPRDSSRCILAAKARQRAILRKHQRWLVHKGGRVRRSISRSFNFEQQLRSQNLLPLAAEKSQIAASDPSSDQETAEAIQRCSNQNQTLSKPVFTGKEIPNSQPSDDQDAQPNTVPTIVLPPIGDIPKRKHPYVSYLYFYCRCQATSMYTR